jgi:hypothetical protein
MSRHRVHERADIVKWIKSLRLRLYGHTERTNNEITPKQIVALKSEGTQKIGRSKKIRSDEVEEDLKIIEKNWHTLTIGRSGGRFYLEPRSHE